MYDLPKFNKSDFKNNCNAFLQSKSTKIATIVLLFAIALFYYADFYAIYYLHSDSATVFKNIRSNLVASQLQLENMNIVDQGDQKYTSPISYEQAVIDAVASASPSVVSIVISKNVPVYEQQLIDPFAGNPNISNPFNIQIPQNVQKGTEYQEVGAGSGFIVSTDGLVLTNKHVVSDKAADYTVFTNDGKKYQARVLARDPVQDLAIIKIQLTSAQAAALGADQTRAFPSIKIGDSDGIQIGQGAIAIGNALGEFSNTVSVGVVSGLGRSVAASGAAGFSETLEGTIQTDAAINLGNSGGPLINLKGEVIGVNTATAQGAQSIGFAIPINIAKRDISQIIATNKITYPFLGVRYLLIDEAVKDKYKLSVDYGALVIKGDNGEAAVSTDSGAQKAGIREKDIILEVSTEKITTKNSMQQIIARYSPNDKVTLKVLRNDKEMDIDVTLGERS